MCERETRKPSLHFSQPLVYNPEKGMADLVAQMQTSVDLVVQSLLNKAYPNRNQTKVQSSFYRRKRKVR